MKNVFLASYFADVAEVFGRTEENLVKGKTVTFIPTASIHEEITFYVDDGKKALEKLGLFVDVLDVSTASNQEIAEKLESNDFIYVTGGNAFFLLQELKRTHADIEIIRQINKGKTYIGESAGSMILSPSIGYARDMDDWNAAPMLDSYEALNVINFFPLPHYGNFPFEEVTEKIILKYTDELRIKPFNNAQAFRVQGESITQYSSNETMA